MRWLVVLLGVALAAPVPAQVPDTEALVALLRARNFAELEKRVGSYQVAYEASTDAEWNAALAFAAFQRVEPELEAAHDAWVKAHPYSYAALLSRGAYHYQRGWSSRGGDYADKTAGRRFDAMSGHLQSALRDLEASIGMSARPQLSFRYLIGIAMAAGNAQAARRWHDEALRFDPGNHASRRAYLNSLRPEWGTGDINAMAGYVDAQAAQARSPRERAAVQRLKASTISRVGLEAHRGKAYDDAVKIFSEGLAQAEDPILLANRALSLRELGRLDEAMRDLNRSLELDPTSGEAYERRANLHERRKEMKEALRDMERAASYGRLWAMQRLGLLYINGQDVPKDYARAAKWLKLGAELGDGRAQSALGWMYSEGAGVTRDVNRAVELWQLAAAQGNAQARKYLEDLKTRGRR